MRFLSFLPLAASAALLAGCPDTRSTGLNLEAPETVALGVPIDVGVSFDASSGPLCGATEHAVTGIHPMGGSLPDPCRFENVDFTVTDEDCDGACTFDEGAPAGTLRLTPARLGDVTLTVHAKRNDDGTTSMRSVVLHVEAIDHLEMAVPACGGWPSEVCGFDLEEVTLGAGVSFERTVQAISTEGHVLGNRPAVVLGEGLEDVAADGDPGTSDGFVAARVTKGGGADVHATLGGVERVFHVATVDVDASAKLELHAVSDDGVLDPAVVTRTTPDTQHATFVLTTPGGAALVAADAPLSVHAPLDPKVDASIRDVVAREEVGVASGSPWVTLDCAGEGGFDVLAGEVTLAHAACGAR